MPMFCFVWTIVLTNIHLIGIIGLVLLFVIGVNRLIPVYCSGFSKETKTK